MSLTCPETNRQESLGNTAPADHPLCSPPSAFTSPAPSVINKKWWGCTASFPVGFSPYLPTSRMYLPALTGSPRALTCPHWIVGKMRSWHPSRAFSTEPRPQQATDNYLLVSFSPTSLWKQNFPYSVVDRVTSKNKLKFVGAEERMHTWNELHE